MNEDYLRIHSKRFENTVALLEEFPVKGAEVLSIGGEHGILRDYLSLNASRITVTTGDVRKPFPYPENSFDLVLCLEVIEHIKDISPAGDTTAVFTGSGITVILNEMFRVLKAGGCLLLSTPNVHCFRNAINWFFKQEMSTYFQHPRELTESYLVTRLRETGFAKIDVRYMLSWYCHGVMNDPLVKKLHVFMQDNGIDTTNRKEDNLFLICTK